jgi:hypothetical protein
MMPRTMPTTHRAQRALRCDLPIYFNPLACIHGIVVE